MKEIAIYVEGGGDTAQQRAELRNGFDRLLDSQKQAARVKKLGWKLVPSGSREHAFRAFRNAIANASSESLIVLLVDSEESLPGEVEDAAASAAARIEHLKGRDGWDLKDVESVRVHLMVQCMEAWLVADSEQLAGYYGKDFRADSLPVRRNLEEEPKGSIFDKLKTATRGTSKGEYAKIKHRPNSWRLFGPSRSASDALGSLRSRSGSRRRSRGARVKRHESVSGGAADETGKTERLPSGVLNASICRDHTWRKSLSLPDRRGSIWTRSGI